uniref:Uncharacterized protein n=1 Tax=Triticum urartu TaxID=4572 RepID=A0A8R7TXA6_TRIUA
MIARKQVQASDTCGSVKKANSPKGLYIHFFSKKGFSLDVNAEQNHVPLFHFFSYVSSN